MPNRALERGLALPQNESEQPAYRWLYSALRLEILHGRLPPGARLPSTRELASQYKLARGTIVNAFEQLKSEGYVGGRLGSGTYVSKVLPEKLLQVAARDAAAKPGTRGARAARPGLSEYGRRARLFVGYQNRPTRAFRANLPALDLFPTALWAKITTRCLKRVSTFQLMGCGALGYMPLRKAVAEYLSASRGVGCVAEQVAIVSGVQEAIDVTARLLLNPGAQVCMENPGYPGAQMVFEALRAKIRRVEVDGEGVIVGRLPARGVRLIYVTPGHQFPLGTTMSLARRLQLLEWARRAGATIFEDDYDSEYRYAGRPIPALQGLDSGGVVLYAGTFSKVLFPSLRLGYVVVPEQLLEKFEAVQSLTIRHAPLLEQMVLTEFLAEGHFGRHLRRMREVYAQRLGVLLEEARSRLRGLLEISSVEAGLQTIGWLRKGVRGEAAVAAAHKRDVDVTTVGAWRNGGAVREGLQMGFAAVDVAEIRRGTRELAAALEGME